MKGKKQNGCFKRQKRTQETKKQMRQREIKEQDRFKPHLTLNHIKRKWSKPLSPNKQNFIVSFSVRLGNKARLNYMVIIRNPL